VTTAAMDGDDHPSRHDVEVHASIGHAISLAATRW